MGREVLHTQAYGGYREGVYMNLKRLRKTMGCLMLTGTMVLAAPQAAFAAESRADTQENKEQGTKKTEASTEPVTEKNTEPVTEPQTESQSESETDAQTETTVDSETQAGTKRLAMAEIETQATDESDSGTGTETESQTGDEASDLDDGKEKGIQVVDTNEPDEELIPIEKPSGDGEQEDHSDANANLTTNIIAGNGIYLDELSGTYYLTFEDGFEDVMDEIEADFRQWLEKPDEFIAKNWQDVLAVYVLRTRETSGNRQLTLNKESKGELEKIFFLMNIRSDSSLANKLSKEVDLDAEICSLTANDYAELKNLGESEREILDKYTNSECRKLCAVVTAAKGFVRGEVGADVSEKRVAIVSAACSLVGKVGYFWGGKSYAIGWDSLWGNPMTVTAGGSKSTGTSRGYGLDCSGFVCWSYYNGLGGTDGGIGNHTTTQWNASEMVDSKDAKPGDMVFYNSPVAGDQNHVGLVIGKNEDGSLLVAHCSSSRNGVVVGEAWSSGFKYVRRALSLD